MSILKTIYLQHLNGAAPNATLDANGNMTVTGTVVSSSPTGGMRNKIINGDMRIDQRNAGGLVTSVADGAYTIDRHIFYHSYGTLNIKQNLNSATLPAGFTSYLGVTVTSSGSAGTSGYCSLQHCVEGLNISDLALGTSSASSLTLSFWVYSSLTGTFSGSIQTRTGDASYPFNYTISSANTWTKITITAPGTNIGTWYTDTGRGLIVIWDLGNGSSLRGTAGTWSSSNYQGATGSVSLAANNGATWYITGVQLEAGTISTPFERRPYGTELALCQRYYTKSYSIDVVPGTSTTTGLQRNVSAGGAGYLNFPFPVEMRIAPTITAYNSTGTSGVHGSDVGNWTIVTSYISTRHYHAAGAVTSSQWTYGHYVASAEL